MTCILPTTWNVNFALVDEREENITQEESYELGALMMRYQLRLTFRWKGKRTANQC